MSPTSPPAFSAVPLMRDDPNVGVLCGPEGLPHTQIRMCTTPVTAYLQICLWCLLAVCSMSCATGVRAASKTDGMCQGLIKSLMWFKIPSNE